MISQHRPTMRDVIRAVAAGIVLVFAIGAVSFAYAAGRHASRPESSQNGARGLISVTLSRTVAGHVTHQ
jgi:hypothetical protein